jgi:hypothetical protein
MGIKRIRDNPHDECDVRAMTQPFGYLRSSGAGRLEGEERPLDAQGLVKRYGSIAVVDRSISG